MKFNRLQQVRFADTFSGVKRKADREQEEDTVREGG